MPRLSLLAFSMTMILASGSIAAQSAAPAKSKYRSAKDILDASPTSDWRTLDPADTLYMDLPKGRVVIELAPGFAPAHVANIKTMARGGFWDGTSIYRAGRQHRCARQRAQRQQPVECACLNIGLCGQFIDQADRERFVGIDHLAAEQHASGAPRPDRPPQQALHALRHHDAYLGLVEADAVRAFGHDAVVAAQRQHAAAGGPA